MHITVLGSGTCASHVPGIPTRFPPGFLVEYGEERILFECSEGIRFRLEKIAVPYGEIQHLAISHIHADHFALPNLVQSMFCYGLFCGSKPEVLSLYVPDDIAEAWPMLFKIYVPEAPSELMTKDAYLWPEMDFHRMPREEAVKIGAGTLTAAKVYHGFGRTDAVAFRLETPEGIFVYSGDTGECAGIRQITKDADIFICESAARIGDETSATGYGHLNPRQAGEIAKQAGVKKLVLTHYIGLDDEGAMIADCKKSGFAGEVSLAKDFAVIKLQ